MLLSFVQLFFLLVLVVLIMVVGVRFLVKIMVKTAPEDIQEKVLARPDDPKWMTAIGFILMGVLLLLTEGIFVWAGVDAVQKQYGFGMIFMRFLILLEGYKLFDMICFDWILLTKLHIFQKLFPETEGCKGYEAFGFNFREQVLKMVAFVFLALLLAAVVANV